MKAVLIGCGIAMVASLFMMSIVDCGGKIFPKCDNPQDPCYGPKDPGWGDSTVGHRYPDGGIIDSGTHFGPSRDAALE